MYVKKTRICVAILLALLIMQFGISVSCSPETEPAVKVGAVYPLSGSLATAGENARNGILFAVDIVNNEYDLDLPLARPRGLTSLNGARLEVIFSDSQGSPDVARSAAEKLIAEEQVVALIGCYQSAVTEDVSRLTETKGLPFLTATSTAPSLTRTGLQWLFRTTPDEEIFIQNFYQLLHDVMERKATGTERLGIVYENSVWGTEVAEYVERYARIYGYQMVEKMPYPSDTTNVTAQVQRLKDSHLDVLMQASYTQDAILYMRTYKEMKFNPSAILADDAGFAEPEFIQTLGNDGDYVCVRRSWSADLARTKPLVGTVNELFRQKYGTDMDDTCARAFTGMLVLADAINRAGSTRPEKIREALLKTDLPGDSLIMPWDGVRFDPETRQNTLAKGIICQIIDQQYYTVWPWDLATRDIIWPMPTR
jgi:branched-chain amino acid transport system substrate-binding protein